MPRNNRFQHQEYRSELPTSKLHLLRPEPPRTTTPADLNQQLADWGTCFRSAGVAAIYLVHGSFVGADALGFLREIARVWPAAGDALRRIQKQTLDNIARESGNFTREYARQLQDGLQGDHPEPIPVSLFSWSSENHHIGRADGAIRLLTELAGKSWSSGQRIQVWGHSHGGNLFALLTNLLANDRATNERFFRAASPYYRWPGINRVDIPHWPEAAEFLASDHHALRGVHLDLVTMGTPIRYGWDPAGYAKLLHFINHRPMPEVPKHLARFPRSAEDLLQGTAGDVIQQFGIAGTNFAPAVWAWRASLADRALGGVLEAGVRKRDLLNRLRMGCRLHADGENLLVDYGPSEGNIAQHLAGHAVYTRSQWLAFHLKQIARRFYGCE